MGFLKFCDISFEKADGVFIREVGWLWSAGLRSCDEVFQFLR